MIATNVHHNNYAFMGGILHQDKKSNNAGLHKINSDSLSKLAFTLKNQDAM